MVGNPNEKTTSVEVEKELPLSIEQLKKQMKEAADALNFEEAAKLRDKLRQLEKMVVQDL